MQTDIRVVHKNPMHPYSWEFRYRNGGSIKQFDFDGYHYSHEIDRQRVGDIVILGHLHSPVMVPNPENNPPDEIFIQALVLETMNVMNFSDGVRNIKYQFGYRFGDSKLIAEIDDRGNIWQSVWVGNSPVRSELWRSGLYNIYRR